MVLVSLCYPDYVPSWNAELQTKLMYEDEPVEPKQEEKPTLAEEATEIIEIIAIDEEKENTKELNEDISYDSNDDFSDFEFDSNEEDYEDYWCSKRHYMCNNREPHAMQRPKKKNKNPRVNPDRWVSARQLKREERKNMRIAYNFEPKSIYYVPTPVYSPPIEDTYVPPPEPVQPPVHRHNEELEVQMALERSSEDIAPCGLSYQQIQELMNRDLTAEDFALLLELDETVAPITLSESVVDSYPVRVVEEGDCCLDDHCPICMSNYEVGEMLKKISSCGHEFHEHCISYWLRERSTMCPLDNISLST
jgi:hypothetical protein